MPTYHHIPGVVKVSQAGSGAAAVTAVWDRFTDTNGTTLPNHIITPVSGGMSWQDVVPNFNIQSNVVTNITTAAAASVISFGKSDVYCRTKFWFTGGNNRSGFRLRLLDNNNYWWLRINGTDIQILEVSSGGGIVTRATTSSSVAADTWYTLIGYAIGTGIYFEIEELAATVSYTSSLHQTNTKHGIVWTQTGATSCKFDDYMLWSM